MSILLFLVQGVPEIMGLLAVSLALARVPLKWEIIIIISIILAVITFFIRALPLTVGIHTVFILLSVVLIIVKLTKTPSSKSFIVVFLSAIILSLLELAVHEPFFALTGLNPKELMSNELIWPLMGLPQAVIMNLIAIIISKKYRPLNGVWKI